MGDGLPHQCEHWFAMTTLSQSEVRRGTDYHTSDIGHWFGMTTAGQGEVRGGEIWAEGRYCVDKSGTSSV